MLRAFSTVCRSRPQARSRGVDAAPDTACDVHRNRPERLDPPIEPARSLGAFISAGGPTVGSEAIVDRDGRMNLGNHASFGRTEPDLRRPSGEFGLCATLPVLSAALMLGRTGLRCCMDSHAALPTVGWRPAADSAARATIRISPAPIQGCAPVYLQGGEHPYGRIH